MDEIFDYILYQVVNRLKKLLEEKKKLKDIKPNLIKDKLFLFLRATVANPSFNSQTKEQLTTQSKDFGCSPNVTDAFITKLYKSSITEDIVSLYRLKEQMDLSKATDGTKKTRLYIDKLEDATWAGSNKSQECSLFVTEGLSASTFAKWGRNIIGNEKFGVFALKGKVLNIRDATVQQLINNEEINNIKQILGLKQNVEYTKETIKNLRYGSLIILTDADADGHHISSLIVNLFHYWLSSVCLSYCFCVFLCYALLTIL
jgi:DNA topoisomerase-2